MPTISGGAPRNCWARSPRVQRSQPALWDLSWPTASRSRSMPWRGCSSIGRASRRRPIVPNALLLGYGLSQPSFRHRMQSLVATLEGAGWQVRCEQFPSRRYGLRTLERRALLGWADVAVLHQIKLSALEARLFANYCRHRVFDVDDAIYVRKPRSLGQEADDSIWRRRKFAATCRWVDVVAAGNEILAGVAGESARRVEVLPTSIDASAYRTGTAAAGAPPTIVWIGSPENLVYLQMIRPAFARPICACGSSARRIRIGRRSRSNASLGAAQLKPANSRALISASCRSATMPGLAENAPSNYCNTWRRDCLASPRRSARIRKRSSTA